MKRASIAWSDLQTLSGSPAAKTLPTHLRGVAKPDKREASLRVLASQLVDGERAASATPVVATALLDMVADSGLEGRERILEFILFLVTIGDPARYQPRGLSPTDPVVAARFAEPSARATREVVQGRAATLIALLSDGSPHVRAAAACVLGLVPGSPADVEALSHRLEREPVAEVRAALCFALMYRAMYDLEVAALALRALDECSRTAEDPLTRGAAWLARVSIQNEVEDEASALATLAELFRTLLPRRRPPSEAVRPWLAGTTDQLTFMLMAELGERGRWLVVRAALAVLEEARPPLDTRPPSDWTSQSLDWYFPRSAGPGSWAAPCRGARELTDRQRELLTLLSRSPNTGNYDRHGLPPDLRARRRFLALDPPGVLDECVDREGTEVSQWVLVNEAVRATSEIPVRARVQAVALDLDCARELEVWTEIEARAYGLNPLEFWRITLESLVRGADPSCLRTWSARYRAEIRDGADPELAVAIGWALLIPILASLAPSAPLPPDADDLIFNGAPNTRESLARVPAGERRGAIIRRWLDRGRRLGVASTMLIMEQIATEYLDLVPEAAPMIVEELARPELSSSRRMSVGVLSGFHKHRDVVPGIDELLRKMEQASV